MVNQMTPAEMREEAKEIRSNPYMAYPICQAAADAMERLADVIEYLKLETARQGSRWAGRRAFARDVLNRVSGDFHTFDAAREDTTNENRSADG